MAETQQHKPNYIAGLDLGQSADFTALAILEQTWRKEEARPERQLAHYTLSFLHRWPLGTSYVNIVADVARLVATPPLRFPTIAVDQTGVGATVVNMLQHGNVAATIKPVLITSGFETTLVDGAWHTPKKELVSVLQVLLQQRRLKVAAIPNRALLVKELQSFKVKVTTNANETFESWREKDHDDMVLAVALAVWLGSRSVPMLPSKPLPVGPSPHRSWLDRRDNDRDHEPEVSEFDRMLARRGRR